MHLEFEKPTKKKNYVVVPVKGHREQSSNICVHGRVQHVQCLADNKGWLVVLWISRGSQGYKKLQEFDEAILNGVVYHNKLWFKNELEEDTIREFFAPSVEEERFTLHVLHEGNHRYFHGKERINSMEELLVKLRGDARGYDVTMTMACTGAVLKARTFSTKWKLRSMEVTLGDEVSDDDESSEPAGQEKLDIELHWGKALEIVSENIGSNVLNLQKRIARLEEVHEEMKSLLERAKATTSSKEWNETLELLESKVWAYRSGELRLLQDQ